MNLVRITLVFGIIAILLSLISAILFVVGCDYAGAVGVVSTIISVLLSLVSIVYTYISGKATSKLMEKIAKQNNEFIEKIKADILRDNYNDANLKDARKED